MSHHRHHCQPLDGVRHPDWSRSAAIYEINTRQFTPEGTLRAASRQLPRLKRLGVDILWLMPVHPIGEENRKGALGSPYAVRDYYAVNPEFGTLNDLKDFVAAAHAEGLYVILDWVANHTAWDNPLRVEHPDWYARDPAGRFRPTPWQDWSDIIELDYAKPALREWMTEAMTWWLRETDIDGYRCDVAGFVPLDFWNALRPRLDAIKPVFMLAEWDSRDLHGEAFDSTYAWDWYDALRDIAAGRGSLDRLLACYAAREKAYPADAYRMTFVTNHDKNAWEGTMFEAFGDALDAAIVLSVVGDGMPLVYNGQEAGNDRRLAFFERDPIDWRPHPIGDLYRDLFALKKSQSALWNGAAGAPMRRVANSRPDAVLSFTRRDDNGGLFAVFNLSPSTQHVRFRGEEFRGRYHAWHDDAERVLNERSVLDLEPWGYRVFVR